MRILSFRDLQPTYTSSYRYYRLSEMLSALFLIAGTAICIVSADITIECPQCNHLSADLDDSSWIPEWSLNSIRNEACIAIQFDPNADGVDIVQCTATGTQIPKCVSFDGEIDADLTSLGITALTAHIKYCAVVDTNPGNVCEDTQGTEHSNTDLAQHITRVVSVLNFMGDDSFTGRICYSDGYRQPDERTVTCPQCKHISTDRSFPLSGVLENQACIATPFDPTAEGVDEMRCTPTRNQSAKCASFDGEINANVLLIGSVTLNTHIKDCTYVDTDPGTACEDVSGNQNTASELGQMISRVLSTFNVFGDETFTGRLCYYGDNTTSKSAWCQPYGTVLFICLMFIAGYVRI